MKQLSAGERTVGCSGDLNFLNDRVRLEPLFVFAADSGECCAVEFLDFGDVNPLETEGFYVTSMLISMVAIFPRATLNPGSTMAVA
jgi:hypothetical protein